MSAPRTQSPTPVRTFTQRFSATRRGARLARLLAAHRLTEWGHPHGAAAYDTVVLVVAELAANAVLHGRVPGRDFSLLLALDDTRGVIRVEVSDTHPALPVPTAAAADEEHGRGLALVDALAARWGVTGRTGPGKTVWAECATVTDGPRPTRTPPGREAVSAPPEGRPRPTPAHGLVSVPDTDV
ncbi:ATP-binding protein [Streptomyces prasinopilosus]|uniref:Anti-sigma regulatory factor (Ser/Thr protein kinase) n=1 Tax=Streptomyces prasinopilosus TaxID=67344 RepID=A0A1G6YJF8_9ACTN|nr:Anti-sigma regulatory factor (Ser/Thr protein kinase) [Streptomyces prasinopilosus]